MKNPETDALRLVPVEPTEAVLTNMVIRFDHGLGCPGYYDNPIFGEPSHARRFEAAKTTMRQLYEEVVLSAAAPASPLPGGGDRRIKSELDFIKDIAGNVQRDLAELEDGFSKSQRTAKTDRAVAKMRERCAVLIQCADDALSALPAAPTGEPK